MFTEYSKGCLPLKSLFFSTVTLFCVTICVKCMYTDIHTYLTVLSCKWSCNKYFMFNSEFTEEAVTWNRKFSGITFCTGNHWVQFHDLWQTAGEMRSESFLLDLKSVKVFQWSGKHPADSLNTDILYLLKEETEKSMCNTEAQLRQGWTHSWNKLTGLPWHAMPTFALAPKWSLLMYMIFTSRVSWKQ